MRFYSSYMISVYSTNISLAIITARLYYIHYILYIYCTLYCFVKYLCFITTHVNAILCSQLNKRMNKPLIILWLNPARLPCFPLFVTTRIYHLELKVCSLYSIQPCAISATQ